MPEQLRKEGSDSSIQVNYWGHHGLILLPCRKLESSKRANGYQSLGHCDGDASHWSKNTGQQNQHEAQASALAQMAKRGAE